MCIVGAAHRTSRVVVDEARVLQREPVRAARHDRRGVAQRDLASKPQHGVLVSHVDIYSHSAYGSERSLR